MVSPSHGQGYIRTLKKMAAAKTLLPVRTMRGDSVRHFFLGESFLFLEESSVGFFLKAIHVSFRIFQGMAEIPADSEGKRNPAQDEKEYRHGSVYTWFS